MTDAEISNSEKKKKTSKQNGNDGEISHGEIKKPKTMFKDDETPTKADEIGGSEKEKKKKKKKSKANDDETLAAAGSDATNQTNKVGLIKPGSSTPALDSSKWPLLLKNFTKLNLRTNTFTPLSSGYSPRDRPLKEYIRYGIINLEKPCSLSADFVAYWVKRELRAENTGHSGALDPIATENVIVCLDRATQLVKSQEGARKQYVCTARLQIVNKEAGPSVPEIAKALENLTGPIFKPPMGSGRKRQSKVRVVHESKLLEYDPDKLLVIFWISCEAVPYVSTICDHLGSILGVEAHMQKLHRVCSAEMKNMVKLYDVMDAQKRYDDHKDESYLRRVIMPLEVLLTSFKRLAVMDSAVNALCYGEELTVQGLLRFEDGIEEDEEVVLITTKGEAIALGNAQMTSLVMLVSSQGVVAKVKTVLMDRDTYPGALAQNTIIAADHLDKHGEPTKSTPAEWSRNVVLPTSADSGVGEVDGEKRKKKPGVDDDDEDSAEGRKARKRNLGETGGSPAANVVSKKSKTEGKGVGTAKEVEVSYGKKEKKIEQEVDDKDAAPEVETPKKDKKNKKKKKKDEQRTDAESEG